MNLKNIALIQKHIDSDRNIQLQKDILQIVFIGALFKKNVNLLYLCLQYK